MHSGLGLSVTAFQFLRKLVMASLLVDDDEKHDLFKNDFFCSDSCFVV